jgi:uncharacterized protein (TIGR02246 family)
MEAKMRLNISLLTFSLMMIVLTASAQTKEAGDEGAIRQNVQYLESGWNDKSGKLFAKPFAEDADYVVINGMYLKGREVIESSHQRIFDTIYKDTKLTLNVKQIRFLRPEIALVHVSGQRVSSTDPAHNEAAMMTIVMTKEKGSWSISAFQNTRVASAPTSN